MRIQISLQFAVNSHIPYETFTLANFLSIVYGQHQTADASQFDVYGSPLTTSLPNLPASDSERPDYNTQLIPIHKSQFQKTEETIEQHHTETIELHN